MPFLDSLNIDTSSDLDDDQSDSVLTSTRGRGKGKGWVVLHACHTLEEYQDKFPSREQFMSRKKSRTLSNGLLCNYQCNIKNCSYFIRCIEKKLLIE